MFSIQNFILLPPKLLELVVPVVFPDFPFFSFLMSPPHNEVLAEVVNAEIKLNLVVGLLSCDNYVIFFRFRVTEVLWQFV
jgi:hypothetical protein